MAAGQQRRHLIVDQRAVLRKDLPRMVFAQDGQQFRIYGRCVRLVARDDLEFSAAQTGGDLQPLEPGDGALRLAQRLGQPRLGKPEHPHHVLAVLRPARDRLLQHRSFHRGVPHRLQFARRARKHENRRLSLHHDAGRGADRIEDRCTGGHHGLFAIGRPHRVEVHVGEASTQPHEDLRDLLLELIVQHEFAPAELRDDRNRHIVGCRSESAAGDDQVDSLVGQKPQGGSDVARPVAANRDVRKLDTEFE